MSTDRGRDASPPGADDLLTKLRRRAQGAVVDAPPEVPDPLRPEQPDAAASRPRLLVAITLVLPVLLLALLAPDLTAGRWVQALLTAVILAWCVPPLVDPVWAPLRRLRPSPDSPALLGALVAWLHSVVELVRGDPDTWSGTAAVVATLLVLARHVEARAVAEAGPDAPTPDAVRHIARWFAPAVVAVATGALLVWLGTGHALARSLGVAVAVLVVISFGVVALASPAAVAVARQRAARRCEHAPAAGALATAGPLDTVVINRSAVLTTGELALKKIAVTGRLSKKAALTAAAAVEQGSDHPIARAIVAGAELARIDLPRIRDFEANPGEGASARIKDTEVTIGKAALFEHVDKSLLVHADGTPGRTVYVGWGGRARAALTLEDTVRETSRQAVTRLKSLGLAPYLVTDDGEAQARSVATSVGIDPGKARPGSRSGESDLVADLQRQGRRVAVLGRPHPGVLFGGDDLGAAADLVEVAQQTRTVVRQNVGWAVGYGTVALAAAALGVVHPALAAVIAALATTVPLLNARRLAR